MQPAMQSNMNFSERPLTHLRVLRALFLLLVAKIAEIATAIIYI